MDAIIDEQVLATVTQAPAEFLEELDKLDAEDSLAEFTRQAFGVIDPASYVANWHIDAICEHLTAVTNGEISNLLITMPPGHMKSLVVGVTWPAWCWGPHDQAHLRFLTTSYAQELSTRDSAKTRRLIESEWYRKRWGERATPLSDQNQKTRYEFEAGGRRIASSVTGLGTGERGDIVIVDDPHNVLETESDKIRRSVLTWWDETMTSRVNPVDDAALRASSRASRARRIPRKNPRAFVIVQQRVHDADLAGHVLEQGGYTHLCLPAEYEPDHPHRWAGDPRTKPGELLWPQLYDTDRIEELKLRLGSYAAAGQLQQRPAPRSGGFFDVGWFEVIDREKLPEKRRRVARYWDFAGTEEKANNDPAYTVGVRMSEHEGVFYVEDVRRRRLSSGGVERLVKNTAMFDGWKCQTWIEQEPGSSGKAVIRHFQRTVLAGFTCRGNRETGSKETRAEGYSAAIEAGNVKVVRADWTQAFIDEHAVFPRGKFKDQVDAASGAYRALAGILQQRMRKITGH